MMNEALRNNKWPEAVWDVSGAFAFDRELLAFYDFCVTKLGMTHPFPIVHGSPLATPWNSGRVLSCLDTSALEIEVAFEHYEQRKIAIYLTFSNHQLREEHLKHRLSNDMCTVASKGNPQIGNAVILSSDLLNDYIKKQYPKLKRINSILKITCERGRGKMDVYKRYLDEFDMVMMHPDDVLDLDFISQLPDKERIIVLINEYCIRHCPIRHWHYDVLSELSISTHSDCSLRFEEIQKNNGCRSAYTLLTHPKFGTLAQNDREIQALYDLGFRHFKLQGRGAGNAVPQLTNMLRLILQQDAPDENCMQAITQLFWDQYAVPR